MKKFILILLFALFSLFSFPQNIKDANVDYVNITHEQVANGWAVSNQSCYNCASFYYKILRTKYPEEGYYYYYIYLYSNSFDAQGYLRSTYVSGINLYIDNNLVEKIGYVLVEPKKTILLGYLYSLKSTSKVEFTWENKSVY